MDEFDGEPASGLETETKSHRVTLLGGGASSLVPGLALDGVFGAGVTVGGALYYADGGGRTKVRSGTTTEDDLDVDRDSYLGLTVRGGYAWMFTDVIGVWPRLGVLYQRSSYTDYDYSDSLTSPIVTKGTSKAFGLNTGVDLVVSPVRYFALLVGLKCSLGVVGNTVEERDGGAETKGDFEATDLAAAVGLMGYL